MIKINWIIINSNFKKHSGKLALFLTIFAYMISFTSINGHTIGNLLGIGAISSLVSIYLFITSIYITTKNNDSLFAKQSKILSYIGLVIFAILIIINT